jgi:hypothetical protein
MLDWEVFFDRQHKLAQNDINQDSFAMKKVAEEARGKLSVIFEKNLSESAKKTVALARLDTLSTRRPPVFAQEIVPEVEFVDGVFYIETIHEKSMVRRRRYAIVDEGGEPKIDAVYVWRESKKTWDKQESI